MAERRAFDKYEYYRRAVQDPESMADFLWNVYRDHARREPTRLREDFCGDHALAAEWVRRDSKNQAAAVDRDPAPLKAGKARWDKVLAPEERRRLKITRGDVLQAPLFAADIACALNFSYCGFKRRRDLKRYLERCHGSLRSKGILALDVLPANETTRPTLEEMDFGDFVYQWEQKRYDPLTREGLFHIHFQRPGERPRRKVFTYDWRLWTIPELRDLLEEAGFRRSWVYWEGRLAEENAKAVPENCESWVALVVAAK